MRSPALIAATALALLLTACEDDGLGALGPDAAAPAPADALPSVVIDTGVIAPPVDSGPTTFADAEPAPPDAGEIADSGVVEPGDTGVVVEPDATTGCTDGGVLASMITTTNTTEIIAGVGPTNALGELVVSGTNGQVLRLPAPTDGAGGYAVQVPLFCGVQTVTVEFPGLVCAPVNVVTVDRQGCAVPDIQVTLTWDDLGRDFELHLVRPGGRINDPVSDCTWTTCIGRSPDWGVQGSPVDDPHKDVDNTGNFGPENIYMSGPEAGLYHVLVEHWGSGTPDADGTVTISLAGMPGVTIAITDLPSHFTRHVATIDWATRTVTPLSTVTDCTLTWSAGCREAIP